MYFFNISTLTSVLSLLLLVNVRRFLFQIYARNGTA